MNKITIGLAKEKDSIYCGRPSPLGNPFISNNEMERDLVCDLYADWIKNRIRQKDEIVINELKRIYNLFLERDIILGCFCKNKRCHCESIRDIIYKMYKIQFGKR